MTVRGEKRGRASSAEEGDSVPRARGEKKAKQASSAEQARRVDLIVGIMQRQEWTPDVGLRLAAEWKVSESMVSQLSAEASRRCAFILEIIAEPEKLKSEAAHLLVRSMHLAYGKNNAGDVAKVADVLTKITGARAAEKSEITVTAKELETLPAPALLARIDDQIAKLTTARAKLLDEHPELAPAPVDATRTPMWAQFEPAAPDAGVVRTLDSTRESGQRLDVRSDPFCPPDATPDQIARWNELANTEKPE